MQTLSKRSLVCSLFLVFLLNTLGCRVVQVQCGPGKCTDRNSRLAHHETVLTKLQGAEDGPQRSLRYLLTTLKGYGWKQTEQSPGHTSLELSPNTHPDRFIQILVPLSKNPKTPYSDLSIVIETLRWISLKPVNTTKIYVGIGSETATKNAIGLLVHLNPHYLPGCGPTITKEEATPNQRSIHISCSLSDAPTAGDGLDARVRYLETIQKELKPILHGFTSTP